MSDPCSIDPRPDGPLQVRGPVGLTNSGGQAVDTPETYWLCRCGGSANKPFCDGSHKKLGFASARLSDPARRATKTFAGKNLTVHDNRSACAHAGHCVAHSPEVFSQSAKPWIAADAAADADTVAKTIATINSCPSGALAYSTGGVLHEPTGRAPAIRIAKNGPYEVQGGPALLGDEAPVSTEHYTLCRCGQSKNKPFCDGTHGSVGFSDDKN